MINDTPTSPKARTAKNVKPSSIWNLEKGYQKAKEAQARRNNASKRSSNQTFVCG